MSSQHCRPQTPAYQYPTGTAPETADHHRIEWLSGPAFWLVVLLAWGSVGCRSEVDTSVKVFATVDQESAAPILGAFHRHVDKQIIPDAIFYRGPSSAESIIDRLADESIEPRFDLIWCDDLLVVRQIREAGLLAPRRWAAESVVPREMRSLEGYWCGLSARARVILVNTDRLPTSDDRPVSVRELSDSRWRDRCGLSRPTSGSSAIHLAVMLERDGRSATLAWLREVSQTAIVFESEALAVRAVIRGDIDWALVDSDLAVLERDHGMPVEIIFPDQATDAPGTVRIPDVVAVLRAADHPQAASLLADYLVSAETEDRLAMGSAARLPLSRLAKHRPRVLPEGPVRWSWCNFDEAVDAWEAVAEEIQGVFRQLP